MIKTYQRKPGQVDAVQFTNNVDEIIDWAGGYITATQYATVLSCETPAGDVEIHVGDYVVKNGEEDFYPIGPDKFKELYDEVAA